MNYGIGNVKGKGGSGTPSEITFTRTFTANVGFIEELGFIANNPLPAPLEHTDEGDDYVLKLEAVQPVSQISYVASAPSSAAAEGTDYWDLGGRYIAISNLNLGHSEWTKINDGENEKMFFNLVFSPSAYCMSLVFYPKQKQNLSGTLPYRAIKASIDLVLWDTELNQYEIYQTGDITKQSTNTTTSNYYVKGGSIQINLPKKYLIAGIKVNYLYYPNLNASE